MRAKFGLHSVQRLEASIILSLSSVLCIVRGSVSETFCYGSGCGSGFSDPYLLLTDPDPALFVSFHKVILLIIFFESTFTSFFKDKKSCRSHKTVEIKIFLNFLLVDGRIRIRIHTNKLWIRMRIQKAQKRTDPTDPDPEHWLEANIFFLLRFNSYGSDFETFASLWLRV